MSKDNRSIVNFLFEVGILAKTPRSGFYFLGSGSQSVAEHINRVVYFGYVLAMLDDSVDTAKVMKMCLLHDLAEARTSDLNYVHQKYTTSDEFTAIKDLAKTLPFGDDILETLAEFKAKKSKEALLAKDADQLEFLMSLKEQADIGNTRALTWIPPSVKRLKTKAAKELAEKIITTDSDDWWYADKDSDWWVKRSGKPMDKRY
jgi:putative hydrolase of HD superfamily